MNHFKMNLLERFACVTTFVFDLDGVLTDGNVWVFPGNELIRRMNIKDSYAFNNKNLRGGDHHRLILCSCTAKSN